MMINNKNALDWSRVRHCQMNSDEGKSMLHFRLQHEKSHRLSLPLLRMHTCVPMDCVRLARTDLPPH